MNTAQHWIQQLDLQPHPEGGYFREVYRSDEQIDGLVRYEGPRCASTSIYFLLEGQQTSRFHRLASDEIWHFYAGSAANIHIIAPDGTLTIKPIGLSLEQGQAPQQLIPRDHWFAAEVFDKESFILVGCTVAPGFEFQDFELAECAALCASFPKHQELIKRMMG